MSERVAAVRRLNRTITERSGALRERHLDTDRPLAQVRVLFEIGVDGAGLRELRARLGLDSGYLSRLLRGLEADGLVQTAPVPGDQRSRRVVPTPAGLAALADWDVQSDTRAAQVLSNLSESQQQRLVAAMETVSTLLQTAAIEVGEQDPEQPAARHCLAAYRSELTERFGWAGSGSPASSLRPPEGLLLVATLHDRPLGCGGLRRLDARTAEIKHLWVGADARGAGLGRRLVAELEQHAVRLGCDTVRLDSNGALTEAIALYRSAGYLETEAYNTNPDAHVWFTKTLG